LKLLARPEKYQTLTFTPGGSTEYELRFGVLVVELEVPVDGKYDLFISSVKGPSCGRSVVRSGQEPISDAIDAYAHEGEFVRAANFGPIDMRAGFNPLEFEIGGKNQAASGADFILHKIFLERR